VTEAGEGDGGLDQPRQHAGEQRHDRDHVVTPAPPQEHADGGEQDGENEDLVRGHLQLPFAIAVSMVGCAGAISRGGAAAPSRPR
jgi:ABC-type nickel/cobalt efflux system permease component RcnA